MMIRLDTSSSRPGTPAWALLVATQCHENYAWLENGSLDTENPYWKAKGGSDYLVTCATLTPDCTDLEIQIILDHVRGDIECDNDAFREHIIGWKVVPADYDVAAHVDPAEDHYGYAEFLRSSVRRMFA